MNLIRGVLSVTLAITAVQASPRSSNLHTRALATHNCVDFGSGSPNGYHSFGDVCIDIDTTNIKVTYPTLPTLPTGYSYTKAHLYLGCNAPTDHEPGHFPYSSDCPSSGTSASCIVPPYCSLSGTSASCTVPLSDFKCGPIGCNEPLFVAAQGDVSGPSFDVTGWGNIDGGTIFDCKNPKGSCAKYWTFTTTCECPVVTTFKPITCTSTIATTTVFVTKPADVSGGSTTCNDPSTTSMVTFDGGSSTCPICATPYFCGCH